MKATKKAAPFSAWWEKNLDYEGTDQEFALTVWNAAIDEAVTLCDDRADLAFTKDGQPRPNEAMKLSQEIGELRQAKL